MSASCMVPLPRPRAPRWRICRILSALTAGMAVLLLDGCAKALPFSVQALKYRSVDEPEGEGNLRGSWEGFADLLRVNLSLLRRLVRTDDLVLEVAQADAAGTRVRYLLLRTGRPRHGATGTADPFRCKARLLLDSSYLCRSQALFTPVSYTQRPAAAAKLCEAAL